MERQNSPEAENPLVSKNLTQNKTIMLWSVDPTSSDGIKQQNSTMNYQSWNISTRNTVLWSNNSIQHTLPVLVIVPLQKSIAFNS